MFLGFGIFFLVSMASAGESTSGLITSEVELRKTHSPVIVGDTLLIQGRIGSHIYDYLAYEQEKIKNLQWMTLNSFGGDHTWALAIAEKIRDLGLNTRLQTGAYCASACVYIFASGQERFMEQDTWLGVHGARLGPSYQVQFYNNCPADLKSKSGNLPKACSDFLQYWYDKAFAETQKAFRWLESMGVSPKLAQMYFAFDDVDDWVEEMNVLKKPDWVIPAALAKELNLATTIEEAKF